MILNGYRIVAATEGFKAKSEKGGHRRVCAILVDSSINVTPLKEKTKGDVELIGVLVRGDTDKHMISHLSYGQYIVAHTKKKRSNARR